MKTYLYHFALSLFILTGCGQTSTDKPVVSPNSLQDTSAVKLATVGMTDLRNARTLKELICQDWDNEEDALDAEDMPANSTLEIQYRSYCFFDDGTVVKDAREIPVVGTWELNEEQKPALINITFANGEKATEAIGGFGATRLLFAGKADKKKPSTFIAKGFRHNENKNDPFYTENVWWMIKPSKPESDDAIKKRFAAYIHFFVLFYDEYAKTHAKKVSFVGLPSCYDWYAGGIILQRTNKIQRKWIDCFYNEEQAMKAFRLADKLVSKKYDWGNKGDRWMSRSAGVLKQMEKNLETLTIE